ncbi:penicillin-binding protein, beta-lactamase class C [Thaumarchaeota archaeon SCGC AB-539-E09]|nr:penicillin-binding protein, beta-lactamase class C [Thaumarchaeota archaeon SCGC AB-539-E09]
MYQKKSVNSTKISQTHSKGITNKTALILSMMIFTSASIFIFINERQDNHTDTKPFVFTYASPESQGLENETLRELKEAVQGFVDDEEIVGAELVIIKNKNIVLHEAFGWKDKENDTPMEKNTVFNLRSLTKPIIGTAIQELIDENRLSLDTKVSEYIPGFDNEESGNITVEQLLTHHSGLPLSVMTSLDEYETLQSLANATGANGPQFTPGAKFWYSDAGSEVLGALIELESGRALDEYVSEGILSPLGMNNTFYYYNDTLDDPRITQIADLYIGGIGQWTKYWSPEEPFYRFAMGSQGLYGTPLDYARFLTMWLDEGYIGEEEFLSTAAIDRTLTPFSKMSSLGSDMVYPTGFYKLEAYYGQMFILWADDTSGTHVKVIGHTGSDGTYAWVWPELDMIVLYFTQSRGTTSGIKLEAKIDELLIHPEIKELNDNAREKYERYLGSYIANFGPFRNAEVTVTVQNGELAVDIPNQLVFELEEDESGNRRFKIMPEVSISFVSEGETISAMMLNQSGMVFELPKGSASTEEMYPTDMDKYLGVYETEDPNVTISVVIHDWMLALVIPGQPIELDLFPPDEDGLWYLKINPTVAIGFNEIDGKIDSMVLHLPDGTTYTRKRIG